MAQTHKIVQGATSPAITMKAEDRDENRVWQPIDLTNATVKFKMSTPDGEVLINLEDGVVRSVPLALIGYDWTAGDTDYDPGLHPAKFHVTLDGGELLILPTRDQDDLFVEIRRDV